MIKKGAFALEIFKFIAFPSFNVDLFFKLLQRPFQTA